MNRRAKFIHGAVVAIGACILAGKPVRADVVYDYSADTSGLNPASTYYAYFQLDEGNGTPATANTITVSDFDYGGGAASDVPSTLPPADVSNPKGGVTTTGNPPSTLALSDSSDSFSAVGVAFTPGSVLSFQIDSTNELTYVSNDSIMPDEFSFAILNSSGANLATTAPYTNNLIELSLGYSDMSNQLADYETYSLTASAPSAVPLPAPAAMGGVLLAGLVVGSICRRAAKHLNA